jgi:hypothetical protein
MLFIDVALVALAFIPVLIVTYFRRVMLLAKRNATIKDLAEHGALQMEQARAGRVDEARVRSEFDIRYGVGNFLLPVGLLTFFYLIGFVLCALSLRSPTSQQGIGVVTKVEAELFPGIANVLDQLGPGAAVGLLIFSFVITFHVALLIVYAKPDDPLANPPNSDVEEVQAE